MEHEPSLRDHIDLLLGRWWLVAAVAAVALTTALVSSLTTPRVYRAATTVLVDRTGASLRLASDSTGISQQVFVDSYVDTMAEVVKSRAVAELALDRLGVAVDRAQAVRRLQAGLRVLRVRGADVIRIEAEGPTPDAAAQNVNAITQGFIDWHLQSRRAQAGAGREFIESQIAVVGLELRTAENELAAYKTRAGQVSLSEQTTSVISKLADFEAQRRAAAVEQQAIEASLREARAALATQEPTVVSSFTVAEDPNAAQFRQEVTRLEITLAGLKEQFTDLHPQVMATRAQISEAESRFKQMAVERVISRLVTRNPVHQDLARQLITLEVGREAAKARQSALQGIVSRYEQDVRAFPATEVQLARLTRDVRVAEQTYIQLSEKLQEAKIAEASIVGDLRVVDRAVAPTVSVRPHTLMNVLFGALLGLMVGACGVYVFEAIETTFKTPQQVADVLGLPVLAEIPTWRDGANGNGKRDLPLLMDHRRRAPFAEAFRHLRTSLLYLSPDRPLRTVQVTSPGPGEGKTTVSANLAIALSQTGRRVCLMECDLRRPTLSWAFQPKTTLGLSDLLVDGLSADQAVQPTTVENLWLLPSGVKPPNPAELLGSQKMRALLDQGIDGAELMVLDATPVLPVADASVLAPAVDGVILVVHIGKTPRDAARRAREHLAAVGARVLGVVVNGVATPTRGYYHYAGYYDTELDQPESKSLAHS